jgi:hypothetical protein
MVRSVRGKSLAAMIARIQLSDDFRVFFLLIFNSIAPPMRTSDN